MIIKAVPLMRVIILVWQFLLFSVINSSEAIAAIIGVIVVFLQFNMNLNCIGALSFFLRSVHTFS